MSSNVHLSVRVPWHDSGWSGQVCRDPLGNASCILLGNVGERRQDDYEVANAGKPLSEVDVSRIGCVGERGTFLSPVPYQLISEHPYRYSSALKGRIQPTPLTVPAYGAHAIPYYWLLRKGIADVLSEFDVDYDEELEDKVDDALGFTPTWVIHGDNQQAVIKRFFDDVSPMQSLVFFYVKHSPFDDVRIGGPLLVGAARITDIQLPGPWKTEGRTAFPNHMWETTVLHSLRPDGSGGVLLPVAELAERDARGEDVTDALAWAPATGGREFSYVTEHIAHDTAIDALERLYQAALRCRELGIDVPESSLKWLDDRIGELWRMRGPAPGLGAVLGALKFKHSKMIARAIARRTPENADPWDLFTEAMAHPDRFPADISNHLSDSHRQAWFTFSDEQIAVLRLLSRFQLTTEQAEALFRRTTEIELDHDELLEDPYLAQICTIDGKASVPFDVVDRGCFPRAAIRTRFPLHAPSAMSDGGDPRRVQALLVAVLEEAAADGDTLVTLPTVLERIESRRLPEPCPVSEELLRAHGLHPDMLRFDADSPSWPPVTGTKLEDGTPAFKLARLETTAYVIRQAVDYLMDRPRLPVPAGLGDQLHQVLGPYQAENDSDAETEQRARKEKEAALTELYAAPLSVLNGRAGTGKTTLVKALVTRQEVHGKGVLLLAPTGKARVQLQNKVGLEAQTIAQFLTKHDRYDPETGLYRIRGGTARKAPFYGTVVVDESSMLTEEQFGALLDALVLPDRLVLVGDPRQLPPIGAGRPFVDLIQRLVANADVPRFPRVAPGYAELTELRRQKGQIRDDLMLAAWFSGDEVPQGFEEVWERLRTGVPMDRLAALSWDNARPLNVVDRALADKLGVDGPDASARFEVSYGGRVAGQWVQFPKSTGGVDGAASRCEEWQILSPTRGHGWGTVEINRHLKRAHRQQALQASTKPDWQRTTPRPIGAEQIVLGDKVLNNRNGNRAGYPKGSGLDYVANGEIGVVVGQITKPGGKPRWTHIEFSSQLGTTYSYRGDDEDDPTLELAWAITIHKSQGSEFKKVFVMLPGSARRLSREMLYTALTRQQDQVILLHERSIDELLDLTVSTSSETARRLTDLFFLPAPKPVFFPDGSPAGTLDSRLIHLTGNGTLVRSKNEVIIAEILDELVPGYWRYEAPLTLNGKTYRPDFTIQLPGRTLYWEHLGMIESPTYRESWERKARWYEQGGVLLHEKGGGPQGALILTSDFDGVDVPQWTELARKAIGPISAPPVLPSKKKVKKTPPGKRT
ncbi:AAA family ATPase [Thermopolyspora sp. NPDC052614]|uniref:AAA family ATPase n=1 Tax=Thermopolyspora sp. NPDC052614 TaxID=3155682 RepID=UPI00342D649B